MNSIRKYFDALSQDSLGIKLHTVGHHIHRAGTPYPDVSHPEAYVFNWDKGRILTEYQLLYIPSGEGYFEAHGLQSQHIRPGTIVLLYPGVWHRYTPSQATGWEEYWVGFSGNYATYLLDQNCFSPQSPIIQLGFNKEFLETISKLITTAITENDTEHKLASFYIIQLLGIVYASALISKQNISKKQEIINKALVEINQNWDRPISYEALAGNYNVSYVWFRKAFKALTGTSPNQFQILLKLKKAEQMIAETSLSLTEIAFATGFESVFYFSKLFKQKLGYMPSAARKNLI